MGLEQDKPAHNCDLVMKGGITSGVVYPLAVCELSKVFRFRNIGGTSAGAIAAGAAAAAEFGRGKPGSGFALLEELPTKLGEKKSDGQTTLFHFFQPQSGTKKLFQLFMGALEKKPKRAVLKACWVPLLVGTLLGAVVGLTPLMVAGLRFESWFLLLWAGLLGAGVGFVLAAYWAVKRLFRNSTDALAGNMFGICSGMQGGDGTKELALTPWLTEFFDRVAGKDPAGGPLTFGDLWGPDHDNRDINLEMVTTCVSHGRPYRLPFRDDDLVRENRRFYFDRAQFRRLFPERVVKWMEDHPPARRENERRTPVDLQNGRFAPMPDPANLPVIVAVRMSLSFPMLLSAVPLYAVDFTLNAKPPKLEVCWFSDGGMSSNFPVHFFDSLFPRWPTFGINLGDAADGKPNVFIPTRNSSGLAERWSRFTATDSGGQLKSFLLSFVGSMKDWSDNMQMRLPGFRDRVATVNLTGEQGGLNLNMSPTLIKELTELGRQAGIEFAKRFGPSAPPVAEFEEEGEALEEGSGAVKETTLNWESHRWLRMRSSLAALAEAILAIEKSCSNPLGADRKYSDWIELTKAGNMDCKPPCYPWAGETQRRLAFETLDALLQCAKKLQAAEKGSVRLGTRAPRPSPELRLRARI
jgi:predicted acylesterase/phospholipase RssA